MNLSLETYELILDHFPRGIIVTDPKGKIIFANQRLERILGFPAEYFLEKQLHTLVHSHRHQSDCPLRKALNSVACCPNQSDIFELTDGKKINVEYSIYPLLTGNSLEGYLVRVRRELLSETYQSKFVAALGHELKTPLTVIVSYLHLMQQAFENNQADNFDKYLTVVNDKINLLVNLIQGMLDAVKLGSGKMVFHDEMVDIDQQVAEAVEQMQKTIDTHHIKIIGSSNVRKKIDKERLFQVMSNLITNAVKYSSTQEKIEVYLEKFDNHVQIRVKDFGQGMDEEEAEHVFEPFYRTPTAQAQSDDGLGMGLFLSKQIINYYHGKIWFVTELGSGSTFFVNLPISPQ